MFRSGILVVCILMGYVSCDANYRLNTSIVPSAYKLNIRPFFDTDDDRAFTFDGQVQITFTTTETTSQIKFHSQDLTYSADNITVTDDSGTIIALSATNPLEFNKNYSFAYVNLESSLQVGQAYILSIVYEGPIREDLNGFYRNYYVEKGVKKWLGATQMEPTHARKVFPSFDEPELKAVFSITVQRPSHYKPSLSNTKISVTQNLTNGLVSETFFDTPRMSTYLVAFLVSEFEAARYNTDADGNEFGIFTRPEAANQSDYVFDFGIRVVNALSEYFGIDYYTTSSNLKLDHVALPNFKAGAMENWGLVKYREALMLYIPEESTPYYKYRVAQIVAHETTHMWFGNLVTCHWWSNTWLNEGFANYFQDYITSLIEPDVYSANQLVIGSVYTAYDADESPTSPPISNDQVFSPEEISNHFGLITYQKGGSVIRMMHHLLGDAAFKFGLNAYLTANKFQSGYPDLMYSALEKGANATNALVAYDGAKVADIMGSWISQPGHPVLEVEVNYETNSVSLSQRRFYKNGSHSSDELYMIPITYTTAVFPNFENTKPLFILEGKTHILNVSEDIGQNLSWVIFNVQETGFYRVKYDTNALKIISQALTTADHGKIHYLNRAKIVNDLFAFFFADEVSFNVLYDTLEFLTNEDDYNVWYAAIRGLNKLRSLYLGTEVVAHVEAYALRLMQNVISSLGYDVREGDSFETLRNRMQILEFACKLGHSGCLENAAANFKSLVDSNTPITPSLRPVSYCAGLRQGSADDYEFLWNRMKTTNVANEARTIGEILGCSADVNSLNKYLVSMQEADSPIMLQDLTVPLSAVLGNYSHVQVVVDALKQNLTQWKSIYPSIGSIYSTVAGALRTHDELDSFESWLTSCQDCGDVSEALQTLGTVRASTEWAQRHQAEVLTSLRSSAVILPSSLSMILVCMATLALY